jgi:hypothetical protein
MPEMHLYTLKRLDSRIGMVSRTPRQPLRPLHFHTPIQVEVNKMCMYMFINTNVNIYIYICIYMYIYTYI